MTANGSLVVLPHERREGFWANIRGHVLDLADSTAGPGLAPSPDDLYVVSIASELAWTTRRVLRGSGLPDDVSVSAKWRTDPPILSDINLAVAVSRRAKAVEAALAAAIDKSLAARSLAQPIALISWEGADR